MVPSIGNRYRNRFLGFGNIGAEPVPDQFRY
jgi:hypothetical protein